MAGKTRALIATLVLGLSGCAHVPRATRDGRLTNFWSQISNRDYIRVRGIGVPAPGTTIETARRGSARDAALVSARYQLLSVIRGVKISGGITMAQAMAQNSVIKELANDMVRGGDEIMTEWLADDGCVVTLELKRSRVERLIHQKSAHEIDLEKKLEAADKEIASLKTPFKDKVENVVLGVVVAPFVLAVVVAEVGAGTVFGHPMYFLDRDAEQAKIDAGAPAVAAASVER